MKERREFSVGRNHDIPELEKFYFPPLYLSLTRRADLSASQIFIVTAKFVSLKKLLD